MRNIAAQKLSTLKAIRLTDISFNEYKFIKMAAPKKPLNTSTKKISDEEDDDFDDDPKPGKVADDDDDFDEDIPLDDDLGGFDSYDPYDDEDDD